MRRRIAVLLSIVVCSLAVGLLSPATADSKSIDVIGTLSDTRTKPAKPVPGVSISIEQGGAVIGTGGQWGRRSYSITLPGAPIDLLGQDHHGQARQGHASQGRRPAQPQEDLVQDRHQDRRQYPHRLCDRAQDRQLGTAD